MLRADGISFGYPDRPSVLHEVSLSVPAGGLVGVLGPNGSGKTTLLKLLAGLLTPGSGQVTLDGLNVADLSRRVLARRLAVVPQETELTFDYTVLEIVLMGRYPHLRTYELETPDDLEIARRMLAEAGTAHLEERTFRTLSGGEKQRVSIARALVKEPLVILADEPTGNLDPDISLEILGLFEQINEQGVTVIFATHSTDILSVNEHRLLVLNRGTIIRS